FGDAGADGAEPDHTHSYAFLIHSCHLLSSSRTLGARPAAAIPCPPNHPTTAPGALRTPYGCHE
ncbi:MAG: hypothetical protein KBI32_11625, partial [Phycisphaerae bacterium]|nr:hypothetical protein [Phycisphaerae bacterium]